MTQLIDKTFENTWGAILQAQDYAQESIKYIQEKRSEFNSVFEDSVESIKDRTHQANLNMTVDKAPVSSGNIMTNFLYKHKYSIWGVCGVAATCLLYYNYSQMPTKRARSKAARLPNGGRYEVVLIIGSPSNINVQNLARDLNQKGFIIYITSFNEKDINSIESEDSQDIRCLPVFSRSNKEIKDSVLAFKRILDSNVNMFDDPLDSTSSLDSESGVHLLNLKSIIVFNDYSNTIYPRGDVLEVDMQEIDRSIHQHCITSLSLLNNGLLDLLRINNDKQLHLQQVNGLKNRKNAASSSIFSNFLNVDPDSAKRIGGDSKLIFLDVLPANKFPRVNPNTSLRLIKSINDQLFESLYSELSHPSFLKRLGSAVYHWWKKTPPYFTSEKINITKLSVRILDSSLSRNEVFIDRSMNLLSNIKLDRWYQKLLKTVYPVLNHFVQLTHQSSAELSSYLFTILYCNTYLPKWT
ncbi:BA75_03737T0 [Komagataella pastoris]|uniref:BA75_03737T0 n=1 Tax=Komagataella pastoris TaxID=4922 RepID=A0A1B2JEG8_PICPA|nr:BA75_03737T0 [Komagataella pastoris]